MGLRPRSKRRFSIMTRACRRRIAGACLGLVLGTSGCRQDIQEIADQHVRKDMLAKHEKREALPFLEKHGQFFDVDDSTHVDRDVVVPLLKRLQELAPMPQWAMLRPEKRNSAYAVLIELPKDPKLVDRMADAVQEANGKFSGLILQQWGHEWLMIDLIDQQSYAILKESNPDIDNQR
jgi:hypothetical protein